MYSIGDIIVHPMHGAGTIEDITTRSIDGKELDYYIFKLPIYTTFVIVQLIDIIKVIVGLILVKKKVWLNNIVAD